MVGSLQDLVRGQDSTLRRAVGLAASAVPRTVLLGRSYRSQARGLKEWQAAPEVAWSSANGRLRRVVQHAWTNSEYYRDVLDATFGATAVNDLADFGIPELARIPILTRGLLREHATRIRCPRVPASTARTGGSSGPPLELQLDRDRASWEWAHVSEAWRPTGWTFRDWRVVLRAFPGQPSLVVKDVLTRELRIDVARLADQEAGLLDDVIRRSSIRFVHGYPSALSRYVTGVHPAIRGVFLASEPATREDLEWLAKHFPMARTVHFFGLTERCLFGFESDRGCYQLAPTYGIGEVVDDAGEHVRHSTEGRLLGTSLNLRALPLLRYDTGDTVQSHAVVGAPDGVAGGIHAIGSRKGGNLIDAAGRRVPSAVLSQLAHLDLCATVLFVQDKRGQVEVQFGQLRQELTQVDGELKRRLGHLLPGDFDVSTVHVPKLAATTSGGKRRVVQTGVVE
jgi:hypothetical protein